MKIWEECALNSREFTEQTEALYSSDTYVSPDFQCDQTEGFPVSLCVNWEQKKAWLALNYSLTKSDEDVSHYEKLCADFGIRQCVDTEQFNSILHELGKDAVQSAELFDDEEPSMEL